MSLPGIASRAISILTNAVAQSGVVNGMVDGFLLNIKRVRNTSARMATGQRAAGYKRLAPDADRPVQEAIQAEGIEGRG